jgi:hypothetical protein
VRFFLKRYQAARNVGWRAAQVPAALGICPHLASFSRERIARIRGVKARLLARDAIVGVEGLAPTKQSEGRFYFWLR